MKNKMEKNLNKLELLSPAGDFEALQAAVLYGADAIYLGGTMFGMRASAAKFSFNILEKSVKLAHENGVKIYLTCNTIPSNFEVLQLKEFLQTSQEIGVDGLIVADFGVIADAKKYAPNLPLHISTQFGVVNFKTANALYELGAKRVVLARELSIEDVKIIRQKTPPDLELECFVHGAMCVSFSGRCLISQYLLGRDANKGMCAQPCRWSYRLVEETRPNEFFPILENEKGTYILNSKDLCLVRRLNQLKEAGICSFKIEGRAKSAYYVAVVTNAYKTAINHLLKCNDEGFLKEIPWVLSELEKVSHRPYFEGFLFNNPGDALTQSQHYATGSYVRNCDVVAVVEKFCDGLFVCTQKNKFSAGDQLELIVPQKEPIILNVEKMFDEKLKQIPTAPHAHMKVLLKVDFHNFSKDFKFNGCFLRKML